MNVVGGLNVRGDLVNAGWYLVSFMTLLLIPLCLLVSLSLGTL